MFYFTHGITNGSFIVNIIQFRKSMTPLHITQATLDINMSTAKSNVSVKAIIIL